MGFHSAKFGLPRRAFPSSSYIEARDRQTDGQTDSAQFIMLPIGLGHNKAELEKISKESYSLRFKVWQLMSGPPVRMSHSSQLHASYLSDVFQPPTSLKRQTNLVYAHLAYVFIY